MICVGFKMSKLRYFLNYGFESMTDHSWEMQMAAIKSREITVIFNDYTIGIFVGMSSEMNYGESLVMTGI